MVNLLEDDNVWITYHSIPSSLISDITSFVFVCSHKGPVYLPECTEMLMTNSGTFLHYGSLPFTSVVGSESRPSSRGIFVT